MSALAFIRILVVCHLMCLAPVCLANTLEKQETELIEQAVALAKEKPGKLSLRQWVTLHLELKQLGHPFIKELPKYGQYYPLADFKRVQSVSALSQLSYDDPTELQEYIEEETYIRQLYTNKLSSLLNQLDSEKPKEPSSQVVKERLIETHLRLLLHALREVNTPVAQQAKQWLLNEITNMPDEEHNRWLLLLAYIEVLGGDTSSGRKTFELAKLDSLTQPELIIQQKLIASLIRWVEFFTQNLLLQEPDCDDPEQVLRQSGWLISHESTLDLIEQIKTFRDPYVKIHRFMDLADLARSSSQCLPIHYFFIKISINELYHDLKTRLHKENHRDQLDLILLHSKRLRRHLTYLTDRSS